LHQGTLLGERVEDEFDGQSKHDYGYTDVCARQNIQKEYQGVIKRYVYYCLQKGDHLMFFIMEAKSDSISAISFGKEVKWNWIASPGLILSIYLLSAKKPFLLALLRATARLSNFLEMAKENRLGPSFLKILAVKRLAFKSCSGLRSERKSPLDIFLALLIMKESLGRDPLAAFLPSRFQNFFAASAFGPFKKTVCFGSFSLLGLVGERHFVV
jgi:hypothetical protein